MNNYYTHIEMKNILFDKLKNKQYFSLIRFGEGEIRILSRRKHDNKYECVLKNKEWSIDENKDSWFFKSLDETFYYEESNYIKIFQDKGFKKNLEFIHNHYPNKKMGTSIFYEIFLNFYSDIFPFLKKYDAINIVCNKKANYKNLKLDINHAWNEFDLTNSWKQQKYIHLVTDQISALNNNVILFTTGFSSKLLICKLHKLNPSNVYLDCGSIFDFIMFNEISRKSNIKIIP
jgi:ribosomal protein L6P/L9E